MPQEYYNQNKFNAGELSTKLRRRSDFTGYQSGLKECVDFLPQVHGPLVKRPGTRRVGNAKHNSDMRLVPFVFSADTVYVLEFSNLKMRVYKDGALLGSPTPFELVTPITGAMLADMHFTQNGNVMYLVHEDVFPQELIRNGDEDWAIHSLGLLPPPTYEAGAESIGDTTLANTTGTNVNWTADGSATIFRRTDVGRIMVETGGPGIATVAGFTNATQLQVDILTPFSTTDLNDGDYKILGSPQADLWVDTIGAPGTEVTLDLFTDIEDSANSNLISNGTFASGLTDWDDRSRPIVSSGTSTAGTSDTQVVNSGANFLADGVQENYLAVNTTQGSEEYVTSVVSATTVITETGKAGWTSGDNYQIRQTGSAYVDNNSKCILNGQRNGIAWIEQDVTSLSADRIYALKFRVEDSPLSMQVGSTSKDSDIVEERSYAIGDHEVYWYNNFSTNYIQFRNNQNTNASLVEVEMRLVSVGGYRGNFDAGKFVRVAGGLVEITSITVDDQHATGVIRAELVGATATEDLQFVTGTWSLESASWTSALGFPRTITLHDQRLYFGSTPAFPTTLWGSAIANFTSFNKGEGNDDDSLTLVPTSTEVNEFKWIMSEHNLAIGTGHDEFIVTAGLEGTITPTKRKVLTPSRWGSITHRPVRVGDTILFAERNGTAVRAMRTTEDGNVVSNQDITVTSDGLLDAGIKRMFWQQRPTPTLWCVLNDGSVVSGVYHQEQNVTGWVRHDLGGAVQDGVAIPNGTHDQVWFAVTRFTGVQIEYFQETGAQFGKLVTDGTFIYEGAATDEIEGLWWLEGQEVAIVSDNGEEYPNQVVNCGRVGNLFPQVTYAEVGRPIGSRVVFLRPETPQSPSVGYTINAIKVSLSLHESSGGSLNGIDLFSVFEYPFDVTNDLYTGVLPAHGFSDDGKMPDVVLVHDEAKPFELQAITYLIERSNL